MRKEIILTVGLPGSGKSHLRRERFSDSSKYAVFDDFKAGAVLNRSDFCSSQNYPDLITELKLGERSIVIADIDFCDRGSHLEAKKILEWWLKHLGSDYKIKSIFFKKEPGKCRRNLARNNGRDSDSRISMIEKYAPRYFPDALLAGGDEILDVYNGHQSYRGGTEE